MNCKSFDRIMDVDFLDANGLPMIIYGYGELGHCVYEVMKKKQNIIAIIDRNMVGEKVDALTIQNIDVLSSIECQSKILVMNTVLDDIESIKVKESIQNRNSCYQVLQLNEYIKDQSSRLLNSLLKLTHKGAYLDAIDWVQSLKTGLPVSSENNPLPWVTYPFIDFITERVNEKVDILNRFYIIKRE